MSLEYDPDEATAFLAQADRQLARVIKRAGPFSMRPERMQSPFVALFRAIVYQQLSGKAAGTIYARVQQQVPGKLTPQAVLDVDDEVLRGAGMSRAKVAAVKDLAGRTLDGTVPTLARLRKLSDDEIVERLSSVRGVGVWTVEMLLIFRLGRPDVLPVSDLGVRKGFMATYRKSELPTRTELLEHGQRWRPYRSVASWYMWRATEQPPAKPRASKA